MCEKVKWHPIAECEDTEGLKAHRIRKLNSDLFSTHGSENDPQRQPTLLRLPPEIRQRIYALVLGGQNLWVGYHSGERKRDEEARDKHGKIVKWSYSTSRVYYQTGETHCGGSLYYLAGGDHRDPANPKLDLRILRTCRLIYMETALMPYRLNKFCFSGQGVRKRFEQNARPGKKRAQKRAVGKYEIMNREDFEDQEKQSQGTT